MADSAVKICLELLVTHAMFAAVPLNYFFTKVNVKCSLQHATYYFYKSFTVSELVGAFFFG